MYAQELQQQPAGLLDYSCDLQARYESLSSPQKRKGRGQVFTPPSVACFMAGLFSRLPNPLRVLDPGAGIGTLSAALCQRLLTNHSPQRSEFHFFETDSEVIPLLDENMKHCQAALARAGHAMAYRIHASDFLLTSARVSRQGSLFDDRTDLGNFDAVIMNPPYFKISKNTEYARLMERLVHGQPNIYALFMGLSVEMLRAGGELVAITPRSFANGLYFRGFRRWFLERMSLRRIHLFESRTATFRNAGVLQESVITHAERTTKRPDVISISTSFDGDLTRAPESRRLPLATVLDGTSGDMMIRIPENPQDARLLQFVERWADRFADLGLRVSTGPVVLFRATEFLLDAPNGENAAPLLLPHNIRPFCTVWPRPKKNKPIAFRVCRESLRRKLLVPARNYVLLKRFSAKEEKRRLTAGCFFQETGSHRYVGLENHLNYIYYVGRELTEDETYGLAAMFNSALLDRYFRTLSGNTQVNATEVRTMHFPDLDTVTKIGRHVKALDLTVPRKAEEVVLDVLGVNGDLQRYLVDLAS